MFAGNTTLWIINNSYVQALYTESGSVNLGATNLNSLGKNSSGVVYNYANPAPGMVGSGVTWSCFETLQEDFEKANNGGDTYKNMILLADNTLTVDAELSAPEKIFELSGRTITTNNHQLKISNTTGANIVRNGAIVGNLEVTEAGTLSISDLVITGELKTSGKPVTIDGGHYNDIRIESNGSVSVQSGYFDGNLVGTGYELRGGYYVNKPDAAYLASGYDVVSTSISGNGVMYNYQVKMHAHSFNFKAEGNSLSAICSTGACSANSTSFSISLAVKSRFFNTVPIVCADSATNPNADIKITNLNTWSANIGVLVVEYSNDGENWSSTAPAAIGNYLVRVYPQGEVPSASNTVSSAFAIKGADFFVSASGDDNTGNGTLEKPYATINKAVSVIASSTIPSAAGPATVRLLSDIEISTQVLCTTSFTLSGKNESGTNYTVRPSDNFDATINSGYLFYANDKIGGTIVYKDVTLSGKRPNNNHIALAIYGERYNVTLESGFELTDFEINCPGNIVSTINCQQTSTLTIQPGTKFHDNRIVSMGQATYTTNSNSVLGVGTSGILRINGGEIYNNECCNRFTAIINLGTSIKAYLKDVTIRDNKMYGSDSFALHKRMINATTPASSYYYFSGNCYIHDNKDTNGYEKNIYTPAGATVYLNGQLTDGAKLGVYTDAIPTANLLIAIGQDGYTPVASDAKHISVDRGTVCKVSMKSDNLIYLVPNETHSAENCGVTVVAYSGDGWFEYTAVDHITKCHELVAGDTISGLTFVPIDDEKLYVDKQSKENGSILNGKIIMVEGNRMYLCSDHHTTGTGSTNGFCDKCGRNYAGVEIHYHGDWAYSAEGPVMTATCQAEEGICELENRKISFTMTSENKPYTGVAYDGISCVMNGLDSWTSTVGNYEIVYYTGLDWSDTVLTSDADGAVSEGAAPVNAGSYWATITYGTATVKINFEILKVQPQIANGTPTGINSEYNFDYQNLLTTLPVCEHGNVLFAVSTTSDEPAESAFTDSVPSSMVVGTYYVFYKVVGDRNHFDSEIKGPFSAIITKRKYDIPTASVSVAEKSVTGLEPSAKYYIKSSTDTDYVEFVADANGRFNIENYIGREISIFRAGDNVNTLDGDIQTLNLERADAPGNFIVVDETGAGNADGRIIGLDATKLYLVRKVSNAEGIWTDVPAGSTEISGLTGGSYEVKQSADDILFESLPTTAIVRTTVDVPVISSKPYNGYLQIAEVPTSELYTVIVNNGGIETSRYDVVLTLNDAVYYKWPDSEDAEKTLTFIITAEENSWTTEPAIADVSYGTPVNAIYAARFGNDAVTVTYEGVNGTVYASNTIAPTATGYYKATFEVVATTDYGNLSKNVEFKINKAEATVTVTPTAKTLIYNGTEQTLVTEGTSNDGKLQYKLGTEGTYADTVPTAVDAGTYSVYYKVVGDSNHTDSSEDSVEITISPLDVSRGTVGTFETMTYTGSIQTPSAIVVVETLVATGTWSNVANVTDTTTFTANGNFTGVIADMATGMAKVSVTAPTIASKVYNGSLQTADVPASTLYTVAINNGGTEVGSYDVVLTLNDAANYKWTDSETATETVKFEITARPKYAIYGYSDTIGNAVTADLQNAEKDTKIALKVIPTAEYKLTELDVKNVSGASITLASDNTFIMPESDVTVNAVFSKNTYNIVGYSDAASNTVTADVQNAAKGTIITLTITSAEGYTFKSLTVTDAAGNVIPVNDNKFVMPAANIIIKSEFNKDKPAPTPDPEPIIIIVPQTQPTEDSGNEDASGTEETSGTDGTETEGYETRENADAEGAETAQETVGTNPITEKKDALVIDDHLSTDTNGEAATEADKEAITEAIVEAIETAIAENNTTDFILKADEQTVTEQGIENKAYADAATEAITEVTKPAESRTVTLESAVIETLANAEEVESLTVMTSVADVELDAQTIESINEQSGGSVRLVVTLLKEEIAQNANEDNKVYFDVSLIKEDGSKITTFDGGSIKVTVPIPKACQNEPVVVVYTDNKGHYSPVNGHVNADGTYTFITEHLSEYILMTRREAEEMYNSIYDFSTLKVHVEERTADSITIDWDQYEDADGYIIYGNYCNHDGETYKVKKLATITDPSQTEYTVKKLESGTNYKFRIKAYKVVNSEKYVTVKSHYVHAATLGGKQRVTSDIQIAQTGMKKTNTVTLKEGQTYTIDAERLTDSGKTVHHVTMHYESSDASVATVSLRSGKITATGKGTCTVIAIAENGLYEEITVKVK